MIARFPTSTTARFSTLTSAPISEARYGACVTVCDVRVGNPWGYLSLFLFVCLPASLSEVCRCNRLSWRFARSDISSKPHRSHRSTAERVLGPLGQLHQERLAGHFYPQQRDVPPRYARMKPASAPPPFCDCCHPSPFLGYIVVIDASNCLHHCVIHRQPESFLTTNEWVVRRDCPIVNGEPDYSDCGGYVWIDLYSNIYYDNWRVPLCRDVVSVLLGSVPAMPVCVCVCVGCVGVFDAVFPGSG